MCLTCDNISRTTIIAGLFVSIIPSTMDIFGKIILDKYHMPFLSIVLDSTFLFILLMLIFLWTNIISPTPSRNIIITPFWITKLFRNITNHLHLKCIIFLVLLSLFWSGNCIFTYLATLCDVPSFVGMLKGFVSPGLMFASCIFGGKEPISISKAICILFYAFGEIMIDYGEVSFSLDCLCIAMTAVFCTTGKYFMIEKVMNCKLSNKIDYNLPFDPFAENIETKRLLSTSSSSVGNIEMINVIETIETFENSDNDPSIDGLEVEHQIEDKILLNEENNIENNDMESISALLAFGYILPLQIIIGMIVFMNKEYSDVMYNKDSDYYKSAREPWYWYTRIIQNSVFAFIYWAEIHLVSEFSAVYMMVFGAVRNVTTLILSWIILKYKLTSYGWIGYSIAIIAVSLFQFVRSFDKPKK